MKVGILTFHRAHNYGAVLQCYALQQTLLGMGADVCVIDYQPEEFCKYDRISSIDWRFVSRNLVHLPSTFRYLKNTSKQIRLERLRIRHFHGFVERWLKLTKPCQVFSIPADFDVYVIGSDQVWGMNCFGNQVDRTYFGEFQHNTSSRLIGYAISSTRESLDYHIANTLPSCEGRFKTLSFREKSIQTQFIEKTGRNAEVCIDPTLLSDKAIWEPMLDSAWKKRKYLALFLIRHDSFNGIELADKAKTLAEKNGWELVDLSDKTLSIESFLSCIRFARYVVTDSFHGTAMSVIFERQFASFRYNESLDDRILQLLTAIGLFNRAILPSEGIPEEPITYDRVNKFLDEFRAQSIQYLNTNLFHE